MQQFFLASVHLKSELRVLRYVVPASAGRAPASPQALHSPTRCRLKAGLHACRNEQTEREARVAGPMNCVAVPEVARQEAMFTTRCGKSVRKEVHWKNC